MSPRFFGLSKSRLLSYRQCVKKLWLSIHKPELSSESPAVDARFATGHRVGEIARAEYPKGILIEQQDNLAQALRETKEALALKLRRPVFEGTFQHNGVLIRADLMLPERGGYRVVEVKSSASVKDYHYTDCATQTWVMREAGIPVRGIEVSHIDSAFVYPGGGDYHGLLVRESVAEEVTPLLVEVPRWIEESRNILSREMPAVEMGEHCENPFSCSFQEFCSRDFPDGPDYPVGTLPDSTGKRAARELIAEGVSDIRDIPEGRLGTEKLERIRLAAKTGLPYLDPAVRAKLATRGYPRTYMDFETVQFAVPIWAGTRPYQILPFQWSCHIESADGALLHREFLDRTGEAPMHSFAQTLLAAIPADGPIFVYNATFERGRLQELADLFPRLRNPIAALVGRIVDLYPIAKAHYYHRDMHGSWSLKAVLPTIAPELDYENLDEVADGNAAGLAYFEMVAPDTSAERKTELAHRLLAYCERDTLGLVRLAHHFEGKLG